jgi:hypothetical protein
MSRSDDHVIPYEEAVRRRRAIEEAQRQKGVIREVKISDAMSQLLENATAVEDEGPTPAHLRRIVERDLAGGERPGDPREDTADDRPDEAPSCRLGPRPSGA